ncbi:unnamed protein product [Trypanosoma brucei gambiense DAL972]|uniref:Uncharacterized protein n=1 Tax=Trypanosoma brucei gambiense (strain MHOM/CI/86/DAL972) TaxID=679716 RepID=C9ZIE4_TRYB9|nr:uncharacterized protein [Trypanosoma brucei gambiense DAL972]CBH08936.1 unnamed protein product [Trypanosoma brucei gambiense DAL972]|eukprot:XP_011771377.1 uncharacterized protein [Trypanosoma brucei gambiense DAL972]
MQGLRKIMKNIDEPGQVIDASYLNEVRVSNHVVNASLSIGQVLKDLVMVFEQTDVNANGCCLVNERAVSSENGSVSGGINDHKRKPAGSPSKCNMSFTEDMPNDGILVTQIIIQLTG